MITVVSGLPRSGTSLMMQMLQAGGLEPLTDGQRAPDADNPRGYLELERVKRMKEDPHWLSAAEGKAIKVVSALLYDLPPDHDYRIIFMERDIREVLASQRAMLTRRGIADTGQTDAEMARHFADHLAKLKHWVQSQNHMKVLYVAYGDIMKSPEPVMDALDRFLGISLNRDAMRRAIDPALHRQRRDG